jgi:flagellar capping protein FliD
MTNLFKVKSEEILTKGIQSLTKACDILTYQNEQLNEEINALRKKIFLLQDELNRNSEDVE